MASGSLPGGAQEIAAVVRIREQYRGVSGCSSAALRRALGIIARLAIMFVIAGIPAGVLLAAGPAAPMQPAAQGRPIQHRFHKNHIVIGLPVPDHARGLLTVTPDGVDGFAKQIAKEAAEAMGFTVEFKQLPPVPNIESDALISGEIDVISAISIIEERLQKFAFTGQLLVARGAVYARPGTLESATEENLRKGRVVVAGGGIGHQWCLEHDMPFIDKGTLKDTLRSVASGESDYVITTQISGRVGVKQYKVEGLVEYPIDDPRLWRSFAMATTPRNNTLAADLDSGLAILRDNGRFDALYDRWVGDLQPRAAPPMFTRNQAVWTASGIGSAALLAVGAYAIAQRRLVHRTAALGASEARFRVLFDESPDGVMLVDPQTVACIEANTAMANLLGRSREELAGLPAEKWCGEWDDPQHQEEVGRVLATLSGDFDSKVKTADGRTLDVRCRVRPITFAGRTLMQAIFRDITASKRAREAVERERGFFLAGPVVAYRWRTGAERTVDYVSENVRQFGYSADDFLAGRVHNADIMHPDDLARIAELLKSASESGDSHLFLEYRMKAADGRWLWLADYTTIVRDSAGKVIRYEGYIIDTTTQRAAADAVKQSEARYRAIVENIPALVFSYFVAPSGKPELRVVNSREHEWQEIFPWLRIGHDYRDTIRPYIHPDDVEAYDAEVDRARADRDRFEIEFRLRSRAGEYRVLHSRCIAVPVDDGVLWQCMLVDVTEIRRAAEAVRLSEERYREIFNRSYDAIVVFRPEDELILDANQRALELYGYSREEFVGRHFSLVSFSHEGSRNAIDRTVATGSYTDSAWAQKTRDGSTIFVDVSSSLIEYQGKPAILSFNRDITGKLRTETALSESELRYRSFVRHSSEGVWCIDFSNPVPIDLPLEVQVERYYDSGVVTECNDAMARMYGLERAEQLLGRRLTEMMPPEDPHSIEYLRSIIANGYRIDSAVSHERDINGNPKYFENRVLCVIEAGKVVRAWGIQRDITAKRLSDVALEEARQRLTVAVQSADLGVWTRDLNTKMIDGDARYMGFFQAGQEAGPVHSDILMSCVPPEDRQRIDQAIRSAIGGDGVYRCEYRVMLPDGRTRWIASRAAVRRDESGRPTHIAGTSMDITESRLAAEERERLAEQLRQAQKLESLGVMAGGIAHDFNNLLVAIMGNAALALRELPSDGDAHRSISRIEQAAARASDLTRQLLTYAGRDQAEPEPIDLSAVVREMVELVEVSIDRSAGVSVELASDLPLIDADPTQARQVVMNLLSNASESLEGKPGGIRVRTFSEQLSEQALAALHTQGCAKPGLFICVEVSDTGCGMDPAVRSRIFEPFFTTKFTGRGLGLTAVLGIARRHGGAIGIESTAGKGTTFRVYFPAASTQAPAAPAPRPIPEPVARTGTILVIDDEAMVRDVARMCLEDAGFRVVAISDGPQAITHALDRSAEFDGILLDMTMPTMSGPEVFVELRKIRGNVPVLLTSGYAEENAAEQLLAEPKVGFIQKPYRPVQLIRAIQDLIAT
ncbi:MAG: PAS domain S-box protein [Phycisphaerales bacterium]|nr:PAS domain S-box protein [Phycisphaerales bacterium]